MSSEGPRWSGHAGSLGGSRRLARSELALHKPGPGRRFQSFNVDFLADLSSPPLRSLFSLNSGFLYTSMTPTPYLLDSTVRRQRSTSLLSGGQAE